MNTIILTHCGKLGDFLYCLPIASWLAREQGAKIHFALARAFLPFRYITPLLMAQPFTAGVTLTDNPVRNWMAGGQPYKFNPFAHGVNRTEATQGTTYFNLGIRSYPDRFITAYCAAEHGFGWDSDFVLQLGGTEGGVSGEAGWKPAVPLRSEQTEVAELAPAAVPYPNPMDLLELGRMLQAATEVHLWYSGPAALCYLARIPFKLYWEHGHPSRELYLNEKYFGGKLITPVEYVRRK